MFVEKETEIAVEILEKGLKALSAREKCPDRIRDPLFAEILIRLMDLVLERNEIINLTTITEKDEFVKLHLLDSLACVGVQEFEEAQVIIDVGSGAGFPGLPLAALYTDKEFLLTDSLGKRIEFAGYAAEELGLRNVVVKKIRAETAGQSLLYRERFDLSLCRALGKMPVALEYCMPLVRLKGSGIFYKTIQSKEEIKESLLAREMLGCGQEVRTETYADILPGRNHALYIVKKERPTPGKYPRREGVPSKVPL